MESYSTELSELRKTDFIYQNLGRWTTFGFSQVLKYIRVCHYKKKHVVEGYSPRKSGESPGDGEGRAR